MKASCARDFRRGVSLSLAYMIAKYDGKKIADLVSSYGKRVFLAFSLITILSPP